MKKIVVLAIISLLFSGLSLNATPVPRERALEIGKKILAAQPATKSGSGQVSILWDGEEVATKSALPPAFYVVARDGGGFVIIAGDDNVTPVLAISDRNDFRVEGMPDNVKWWMDRMKAYVRSTKTQTPSVREQWAGLVATKSGPFPTGDVTNKVEHLTPEWDQGNNDEYYFTPAQHIFNQYCPKDATDASVLSVTGCVATALAEVLTTLSGIYGVDGVDAGGKLPQQPLVASVEPYTEVSPYASIAPSEPYQLNTTYQWANLRTLTNISAIQAAIEAGNTVLLNNLGKLMADMGAMMHASYSYHTGGTSAYTNRIPDTLARYMGMNKSASFEYASSYSTFQWEQKLKAELFRHPIIYSGLTVPNNYGHAFVFDGYGKYAGNDVFHVNFGWGGLYNGYYYETNMDVNGDADSNYSYQCGAVFDFYPEPTSEYEPVISLVYGGSFSGLNVASAIEQGTYFSLNFDRLANTGNADFLGTVRAVLIGKNNVPKEVLGVVLVEDNPADPLKPGQFYNISRWLKVTGSIEFGDRIVLEYSTDGSNFKRVETPFDAHYASMITVWPLMPVPFVFTKNSYSQNDYFEFKLKNHGCNFADTQWTITDPDGISVVKPQSDAVFQLTKSGAYKIEAAITPAGGSVVETVVTYILVN